ncbi:MAG TPA: hypothetical protein VK752_05865 [Bryobacteraceae bacterium]|jgi:hypothetical protein|nr:hypothetical protein [Bryobacteraceae bacterium]
MDFFGIANLALDAQGEHHPAQASASASRMRHHRVGIKTNPEARDRLYQAADQRSVLLGELLRPALEALGRSPV